MAHRPWNAPTPKTRVTNPSFDLSMPKELPPCQECKTGELFRHLDLPTQTAEIVCLECGHVLPALSPAASTELPMSAPFGERTSTAAPPPPAAERGQPPGSYAGLVLAVQAFAAAALGSRWKRVEVVVIGQDGLPALTVTSHRRD